MDGLDYIYLLGPLLLIMVVAVAALLDRWSVPVILIALGVGIVFGSDVLGVWAFSDYMLTNQVANLALVFILFQGGFSTKKDDFRLVALPGGGLATWGVVLTALATFGVLYGALGWSLEKATLLAVIISSTDAAATFSILRRQSLPPRLRSTVEVESAANDPMAILLTLAAVESFTAGGSVWYLMVLDFLWKFGGGIVVGLLLGWAALQLFNRITVRDRGHYYVLTIGAVLLIYGLADLAWTSGMLAVFVAGFVVGNQPFVHRQGVDNFASALATVADVGMFLLMGLLVAPAQWAGLWPQGIALFLVLTFIARPIAVGLGIPGMGFSIKERGFIAWAGLRGAVPIVLATYPMAAGMEIGQEVFNLVFFAVLLSVLVQGSTLGPIANWLGLSTPQRPKPLYNLELITMAPSDLDLIVVDMPDPDGCLGPAIHDLRLPPGAVITLITRRGQEVVIPKGSTRLLGWDQVTVLAHARDEAAVREALLSGFPRAGRGETPRPEQDTPPQD